MPGSDLARERLLSGRAWDDFCDTLKLAGRHIETFDGQLSDLDRAEWYRFLTRLTRSSMERLIENAEPTRPRLRDMVWRQSINVQTVDQDHLMCQFDEARDYVIEDLLQAGRIEATGYVNGVGSCDAASSRRNLTGDPYFTDGKRAVILLSTTRNNARLVARS